MITATQIAEMLGVKAASVRRRINAMGIAPVAVRRDGHALNRYYAAGVLRQIAAAMRSPKPRGRVYVA